MIVGGGARIETGASAVGCVVAADLTGLDAPGRPHGCCCGDGVDSVAAHADEVVDDIDD